jgi:hypothetical protein
VNGHDNALPVNAELEEKMRETTQAVGRFVKGLLFAGWLLGWGAVAAIGWAASIQWMLGAGIGIAGASVLGLIGQRAARKSRLQRLAKTSLVAKAELEGLRLDRETSSVLGLFDLAYQSAMDRLADPEVLRADLGIDVMSNLDRARDHLYKLTSVEVKLRLDLRQMTALASSSSVASAADELRAQIAEIDREANSIAGDAQKLSARVTEVHRLIGSGQKTEETRGRLQDALRELDVTASAYKEIDDSSLEAAQRRVQQLRKQGMS